MRTRRQDKKATEASAAPRDEVASFTPTPLASEDKFVASPSKPTTVVTISKVEDAVVARPDNAVTKSRSTSKIPTPIQFPLVAVLSFALSQLGYSLAWPLTKGELTTHARLLNTWTEVGIIESWRLFELALGWFGDFDGYDITALNLLSHGPPLYLLFAHYNTPPFALLVTIVIETLATYIPFRLLRPLSRAHATPTAVPNADILTDTPIALLTTLLAGAIYSVTLLFAYATYLPTYLISYFANLPSLARAHESSYVNLVPVTLVLGFAARSFIFTPAEATPRTAVDDRNESFDPVKASLKDTVAWNFWGWSSQTKTAFGRTALLCLVTGLNTFLQTRLTVLGVETMGAIAWSAVWVGAGAVTGLALSAVGGV
ncbi:hypothetical protein F5Y16DRAFT_16527 [Xylariaceae sp. FL0255]|nr:hypothetical protein F5Y16DRAFT_16527 [Xylariaceae sp. FL0255]